MSGIGKAHREAGGEDFPFFGCRTFSGIAKSQDVRFDGGEDVSVPRFEATCDPGHFGVEALGESVGAVGHSVSVGVFKDDNPVGQNREVFPVDDSVLVLIADFAILFLIFRNELAAQESAFFLDRQQREIFFDPAPELPDVEIGFFATKDLGGVDLSAFSHGNGDGVSEKGLLGEKAKFGSVLPFDGFRKIEGRFRGEAGNESKEENECLGHGKLR